MARFFPFEGSAARNTWLEMHHDDASANRPAVPNLRKSVPIAGGRVDEFFRWKAHRFPRARSWYAAVAVLDSHLQSLWLLGLGTRFHRGSRRVTRAQGARVERAGAVDCDGTSLGLREVR